jgi:type IV pilus assembly protein PilF
MNRIACIAFSLFLVAGCVSQSQVESKLPDRPAPASARQRAQAHTQLGAAYFSQRKFPVALEEAKLAQQDDPTFAPAHNLRALIHMEMGEDEAARQAFEAGRALAPEDNDLLMNFGWFECLRGSPARGLELLERVKGDRMFATPEKAWLNSGLCQQRAGNVSAAELDLRRALTLQPGLVAALLPLAELSLARGAGKEAESYFTRYQSNAPATAASLLLGARIARANGERAQEESYSLQLRRRFPDSAEARALP